MQNMKRTRLSPQEHSTSARNATAAASSNPTNPHLYCDPHCDDGVDPAIFALTNLLNIGDNQNEKIILDKDRSDFLLSAIKHTCENSILPEPVFQIAGLLLQLVKTERFNLIGLQGLLVFSSCDRALTHFLSNAPSVEMLKQFCASVLRKPTCNESVSVAARFLNMEMERFMRSPDTNFVSQLFKFKLHEKRNFQRQRKNEQIICEEVLTHNFYFKSFFEKLLEKDNFDGWLLRCARILNSSSSCLPGSNGSANKTTKVDRQSAVELLIKTYQFLKRKESSVGNNNSSHENMNVPQNEYNNNLDIQFASTSFSISSSACNLEKIQHVFEQILFSIKNNEGVHVKPSLLLSLATANVTPRDCMVRFFDVTKIILCWLYEVEDCSEVNNHGENCGERPKFSRECIDTAVIFHFFKKIKKKLFLFQNSNFQNIEK